MPFFRAQTSPVSTSAYFIACDSGGNTHVLKATTEEAALAEVAEYIGDRFSGLECRIAVFKRVGAFEQLKHVTTSQEFIKAG